MTTPAITAHIASINTRHATELAVRSARRLAGVPFDLKVGDCNSTDGSVAVLHRLAGEALIDLEVAPGPRSHASWLDQWLESCPTEWAVFLDSDIQLRRKNWLKDLVEAASSSGAAVVGGESTADAPDGMTREGERRYLVGCRVAPWIMLCHIPTLRTVGARFEPHTEPALGGHPRFYDVASWQQHQLVEMGYETLVMPPDFQSAYLHFRGLSWRRDTGWKGFIRHRLRYSLLYMRLLRERGLARLASKN